jgi:prevent-host-death family protein
MTRRDGAGGDPVVGFFDTGFPDTFAHSRMSSVRAAQSKRGIVGSLARTLGGLAAWPLPARAQQASFPGEHLLREVGAFEAKDKLDQLLDIVEQGEEVIITRHGKEAARLVPARPVRNREQARAAIQQIRERAVKCKLGPFNWSEWKSCRDEGRS